MGLEIHNLPERGNTSVRTQPAQMCSVIVPTYNRPEQLGVCLRALARQTYPRHLTEVIVVDDGSDEPPETVIASMQDALDVTLLSQENAGPASARNSGAGKARGDLLAFTDDDCLPERDWLDKLVDTAERNEGCLIGGRTVNRLEDNPYASAHQLFMGFLYTYYNTNPTRSIFFTSNNMACPTDVFRELQGFDNAYPLAGGEDRAFCDHWLKQGHRMVYTPDAVVSHAHVLTGRTFWRHHFNYGRGAYRFRRQVARQDRKTLSFEATSFYLKLILAPYSRKDCPAGLRCRSFLVFLMFISQIANASGFFMEMVAPTEKIRR